MTYDEKQMAYLTGIPVTIKGGLKIYSVPLRDIWNYGYNKYIAIVSAICIEKDELGGLFPDINTNDINALDFIIANIIYNKNDGKNFKAVMSMLLHGDVICNIEKNRIDIGSSSITRDNIEEFQEIVRDRNLISVEETHENPANEKARRILERSRELKKRRRSADGNDNGMTFADIISITSAKFGKAISEIGEYDIWQLNDQLARLKTFDDYEVGYQALLHGAKKEDVDLKHWIDKNINLFE